MFFVRKGRGFFIALALPEYCSLKEQERMNTQTYTISSTSDITLSLKNRHFLKLDDFTPQEIDFLLRLAADLKTAKYRGTEVQHLRGKQIALIFEKDSTRTRSAFEVAAYDSGAHVTYIGPSGSH